MFQRIVVGVDGRPGGRDALGLAEALAAPGADVELVHVHPYAAGFAVETSRAAERQLADASRQVLDEAAAAARTPVHTAVLGASSPGFGLHARAERTGADLVVIGNSQRPLRSRLVAGDTARAVLHGAPCAVALAAPGGIDHEGPLRVVAGYDGRPESVAALQVALALDGRRETPLRVVRAVHGPEAFAPIDAYTFDFDRVAADVRVGSPCEVLAAAAADADLLVVGSRGYGPLRRLVLGSTSEALIGEAGCALLIVPRVATASEPAATASLVEAAT